MTLNINRVYEEAIESGLLPGVSLLAGDKDGMLHLISYRICDYKVFSYVICDVTFNTS